MTLVACSRCGSPVEGSNSFCGKCGSQVSIPNTQFFSAPPPLPHRSSRGFEQMFGLDPRVALLTIVVDMMLFGGEILTGGLLIFVSVFVGALLGLITYRAQRSWYGDDRESALIKGLIVALLTAIPTPLPALLSIPSGIVGLIHNRKR